MWEQRGSGVNFCNDRTPPFPWERIGECAFGTRHPVVYADQRSNTLWIIG